MSNRMHGVDLKVVNDRLDELAFVMTQAAKMGTPAPISAFLTRVLTQNGVAVLLVVAGGGLYTWAKSMQEGIKAVLPDDTTPALSGPQTPNDAATEPSQKQGEE